MRMIQIEIDSEVIFDLKEKKRISQLLMDYCKRLKSGRVPSFLYAKNGDIVGQINYGVQLRS